MDKYINYYNTLGLRNTATAKEIKLAYYKISKEVHPDKGGDEDKFKKITDAYKVLSSVKDRSEFDTKSKFGSKYDELTEYLDFEFKNDAKNWDKDIYEEFIRRDQLNIIVHIDDTFDGTVEYERWVYCKDCNGCGKDNSAKISVGFSKNLEYFFENMQEAIRFIADENISNFTTEEVKATDMLAKLSKLAEKGMLESEYKKLKSKYENKGDGVFILLKIENNLKRNLLELSDDCDFCDGTGKWGEVDCFYCSGTGIINGSGCKKCKGEKRILGKQKLHGIVVNKNEIDHKVEFMGNVSKDIKGKFGHLWLLRK